jgi:hypothetical protein
MKQLPRRLMMMMLVILTSELMGQDIELKKTEINQDIKLLVPTEFLPMGPQDIRNKFISYRQPLAGFTSEDRSTDLVVNVSKTPWSNQDMTLLQDFYENNIRNLFDEVEFYRNQLDTINGRTYAAFEFTSLVKGDPNSLRNKAAIRDYRYVMYAVEDFEVYIFTFYCPAQFKERWRATAEDIMSNIEFK